jgi:hypothetical protein
VGEREWLADAVAESEWLGCRSMEGMPRDLDYCFGRCGVLFAVACCRSVWHLLPAEPGQTAVLTAERYADGAATREALEAAEQRAYEAGERIIETMPDVAWKASPAWHAMWAAGSFTGAMSGRRPLSGASFHVRQAIAWDQAPAPRRREDRDQLVKSEAVRQWCIVRDIFGDPFHVVAPSPTVLRWEGGTVARLAHAAYAERNMPGGTLEPQRLAVLSDALEEAGADAFLIEHLRGPGPHWRGCWAIDRLTGKG